jgi:nitrate reductase beta subunit
MKENYIDYYDLLLKAFKDQVAHNHEQKIKRLKRLREHTIYKKLVYIWQGIKEKCVDCFGNYLPDAPVVMDKSKYGRLDLNGFNYDDSDIDLLFYTEYLYELLENKDKLIVKNEGII